MKEPVSKEDLQERLSEIANLLDRINISLSHLEGHRLGEMPPEELKTFHYELSESVVDLDQLEWNLDFLQELIESGSVPEFRHQGVMCAYCGEEIEEEWQGEASPSGSMHKRCARESRRENQL